MYPLHRVWPARGEQVETSSKKIGVSSADPFCFSVRMVTLEKPDIIVGTPARILAHLKDKVKWLVSS